MIPEKISNPENRYEENEDNQEFNPPHHRVEPHGSATQHAGIAVIAAADAASGSSVFQQLHLVKTIIKIERNS